MVIADTNETLAMAVSITASAIGGCIKSVRVPLIKIKENKMIDQSVIAPVPRIRKPPWDKWRWISLIFICLFLAGTSFYASYWYFGDYKDIKEQKALELNQTVFTQGAQFGYASAVQQVFEEAIECELVPVTFNNQTINLIATGCLQQGAS